jgi:acyl-CoA thioester hydrolase
MSYTFELKLKVPFHDLDPMRVVWHGNYLKYFDQARFGLFEAAGVDLYQYMLKYSYLFPITRTATKHIAPLQPNDDFICKATVVEARYKIAMEFEIRRLPDRVICTRGKSDQVAVTMPDMEMELEIPLDIRRALGFD